MLEIALDHFVVLERLSFLRLQSTNDLGHYGSLSNTQGPPTIMTSLTTSQSALESPQSLQKLPVLSVKQLGKEFEMLIPMEAIV